MLVFLMQFVFFSNCYAEEVEVHNWLPTVFGTQRICTSCGEVAGEAKSVGILGIPLGATFSMAKNILDELGITLSDDIEKDGYCSIIITDEVDVAGTPMEMKIELEFASLEDATFNNMFGLGVQEYAPIERWVLFRGRYNIETFDGRDGWVNVANTLEKELKSLYGDYEGKGRKDTSGFFYEGEISIDEEWANSFYIIKLGGYDTDETHWLHVDYEWPEAGSAAMGIIMNNAMMKQLTK